MFCFLATGRVVLLSVMNLYAPSVVLLLIYWVCILLQTILLTSGGAQQFFTSYFFAPPTWTSTVNHCQEFCHLHHVYIISLGTGRQVLTAITTRHVWKNDVGEENSYGVALQITVYSAILQRTVLSVWLRGTDCLTGTPIHYLCWATFYFQSLPRSVLNFPT